MWVKYKPTKNQRVHQQLFEPLREVKDLAGEMQPAVRVQSASAKGKQMTTKPIARVSTSEDKPGWWDPDEELSRGIL